LKFIINAWKDCIRRSWHSTAVDGGAEARRDLNDAFKIIFEMRGSEKMKTTWEKEKGSVMSVETAYTTLGVSKDMDETTLITVYVMRVRVLSPKSGLGVDFFLVGGVD
jgi:ubiquitin carboxyl-terminal hydrolase 25